MRALSVCVYANESAKMAEVRLYQMYQKLQKCVERHELFGFAYKCVLFTAQCYA